MPNSKGQVPISGNKEVLHIAEPHKIFGSTLEDCFVTNEGSARSLLASAGLYYGGDRSWTAFFYMLADAIKFFVTNRALFFDVITVRNQIFEPEFKPGLLSELLTDKSFEKFIKKEENQKVVDDLMIKLSKIEEKDRGKLQEVF